MTVRHDLCWGEGNLKKLGLLRVLKGKMNQEQRERLGRKKEIGDNESPSLHFKFEKLVAVFLSNTNSSPLKQNSFTSGQKIYGLVKKCLNST